MPQAETTQALYDDFDPAGYEQWKALAIKEVKGEEAFERLFRTTAEGIPTRPFYTLADERETAAIQKNTAGWKIVERIRATDAKQALLQAQTAIDKGAEEVVLEITNSQLIEQLASLPANTQVWVKGFTTSNATALQDILLTEGQTPQQNIPLDANKHYLADASLYHNAGAETSFELACTLAHINEYYNGNVTRLTLNMAVGSNYFFEIAKLRALRKLLPLVTAQYGIERLPAIYCETALNNKTIYDYNNNILRSTTEAMAAVIGGCDALYVHPYDVLFKQPNSFSERIARNIQLILKYESYMDKVTDAAYGSYYIDTLTEDIAQKSWQLFKDIEARGGWMACIKSGYLQDSIQQQATATLAQVESGQKTVLGVNKYPNKNETLKGELQPVQLPQNKLFPLRRFVAAAEDTRLNGE